MQHAAITGLAAQFASIADDEDDFAARALALAQVQSGAQDGVIQNMRFAGRSVDGRDGRSAHGKPVDRRVPEGRVGRPSPVDRYCDRAPASIRSSAAVSRAGLPLKSVTWLTVLL